MLYWVRGDDSRGGRHRLIECDIFSGDDLCDRVSLTGYDQAITPHLDRLVQRGVTFTNAHAPGTYCSPGRSAIFAGRFATTAGGYRTQGYFREHPELAPMQ